MPRSLLWPDPRVKPPFGSVTIDWNHPLAQGLVGCWLFNEGAGLTAYDLAMNKHGALTNGPLWVPGRTGTALNFDGADDSVSALFDTADIVTVSAWVKMNKPDASDFNFVTQDGGVSGRFSTGWSGGERFYIAKSGVAYHKLTNAYSLSTYNNSWHHIVLVYTPDNTQSHIYVDGVEASYAAASSQTITSNTTVYLGQEGALYSNGLFDDVRIHNRVFSASEVLWLYIEPYAFLQPVIRRRYFVPAVAAAAAEAAHGAMYPRMQRHIHQSWTVPR